MGKLFAAVCLTLLVSAGAQAAIAEPVPVYRLEGNWRVGGMSSNGKSAPEKDTNPQVYSGVGAAEAIFGASLTGYAISTNPLYEVVDNVQIPYVFQPGDLVYIRSDDTYTIKGVLQEIDNKPLHYAGVNKLTFLDGFGDTQYLTNPQSESFSRDLGDPGYNVPQFPGAAYSAWVSDHSNDPDAPRAINYAFVPVPEPQTWMLMLGGGFILVLVRTARNTYSRI